MRITPNITMQNSLYNIQQSRSLLDSIQEKIASGNNYSRPSDDPVAARLLVGINDKLTAGEQYENNIKKAEIWLNMTSTALEGMANYTNQAKSMAASLSSGTTDSNIRDSAISQLQAIKQQLVDMGNTQLNGVYLFGGGLNSTAPFTTSASGGPPATYYHGDETTLQVEISPGSTETMNMIGSQVLSASEATLQPYGSTSILGTIDQLITDITANNVTGIQAGIQNLYQGGKQLESAQSAVATRLLRLDGARSMNESTKNTLETVYSNVQNADYAKLAVQLTQQQTAFEATLAATAKISQLSLLDYL
jgi:flagellar hook-associated protein 3 FlgL